jgi:hypothetical protein
VADADYPDVRAGGGTQGGEDRWELLVDHVQALRQAGLIDDVEGQAALDVVKTQIDGHEDGVRVGVEEADGLGQLGLAGGSTPVSPAHKGSGGLTGAPELDQLQVVPAGPFDGQEVVGVAGVGGLAIRACGRGLEADRGGSTQIEVVLDGAWGL